MNMEEKQNQNEILGKLKQREWEMGGGGGMHSTYFAKKMNCAASIEKQGVVAEVYKVALVQENTHSGFTCGSGKYSYNYLTLKRSN